MAFETKHGRYKWTVMFFSFSDAPNKVMPLVNQVLNNQEIDFILLRSSLLRCWEWIWTKTIHLNIFRGNKEIIRM